MAEVKFKRKSTSQIEILPVDDGSFIVDYETGNAYIDYQNERVQVSGGASSGGETLPVGSEIDFDGTSADIPVGWEQVDDVPVYSINEKICGTWIDNKPIYEKTIKINNINNSPYDYDISSLNVDMLQIANAQFEYTLNNIFYSWLCPIYSNPDDNIRIFRRNDAIRITYGDVQSGGTNKTAILTIRYTKTTD